MRPGRIKKNESWFITEFIRYNSVCTPCAFRQTRRRLPRFPAKSTAATFRSPPRNDGVQPESLPNCFPATRSKRLPESILPDPHRKSRSLIRPVLLATRLFPLWIPSGLLSNALLEPLFAHPCPARLRESTCRSFPDATNPDQSGPAG